MRGTRSVPNRSSPGHRLRMNPGWMASGRPPMRSPTGSLHPSLAGPKTRNRSPGSRIRPSRARSSMTRVPERPPRRRRQRHAPGEPRRPHRPATTPQRRNRSCGASRVRAKAADRARPAGEPLARWRVSPPPTASPPRQGRARPHGRFAPAGRARCRTPVSRRLHRAPTRPSLSGSCSGCGGRHAPDPPRKRWIPSMSNNAEAARRLGDAGTGARRLRLPGDFRGRPGP